MMASPLRLALESALQELASASTESAAVVAETKVARIEAALLHERVAQALTNGSGPGAGAEASAIVSLGSAARVAHAQGRLALGMDADRSAKDQNAELDSILDELAAEGEIIGPTIQFDAEKATQGPEGSPSSTDATTATAPQGRPVAKPKDDDE